MRAVLCVALDPAPGAGGEPSVTWRWQHDAALALYSQQIQDRANDQARVSLFELRVPEWWDSVRISQQVRLAAGGEYRPMMRREPRQPAVAEK